MPSNVFGKNGKTFKRVWAKNDKKYFSKTIKNSLEDFEQVVDSTTPFIDFSAYQEAAEKAESGTITTALKHLVDLTEATLSSAETTF